jgi:hypothetical protein
MSGAKYQVITPPNTLKAKVGASLKLLDGNAVARAEEALAAMSQEFEAWIEDDVGRLTVAWEVYIALTQRTPDDLGGIFSVAHDLKGLGATYNFPLVTRLAGSLCKLIEPDGQRRDAPVTLVGAHVDAIRAAVRDKIKTDSHPVGRVLAEELEARVGALAG